MTLLGYSADTDTATERLSKYIDGYEWTVEDTYAAQNMCPYETVAYGFSRFCSLFTYEEWIAFGYSVDIAFQYNDGFQSPFGVSPSLATLHRLAC